MNGYDIQSMACINIHRLLMAQAKHECKSVSTIVFMVGPLSQE